MERSQAKAVNPSRAPLKTGGGLRRAGETMVMVGGMGEGGSKGRAEKRAERSKASRVMESENKGEKIRKRIQERGTKRKVKEGSGSK